MTPSKTEGQGPLERSDAIVSIDNLKKRYGEGDESVLALEDVDLDVREGEFVSIVGPSGCGKSTLLHHIGGIQTPTSGSVTMSGIDVHSEAHDSHEVGLVFQQPVLLEWRTVMDNVMLPIQIMTENGALENEKSHYKQQARDLIELVGLGGFEDSYPNELSGGMKQRVSICMSLVYDPAVLLMDEPFGSLDALTKDKLNNELLQIWNKTKKTIVFVTHDLEEAVYLSDRVIVISQRPGEIIDSIEVDLDRPRDENIRTRDEFHELVGEAYQHFTE